MLLQIKHNTLIDSHWIDGRQTVQELKYARDVQCKFRLFPMKNLWCTDAIEQGKKNDRLNMVNVSVVCTSSHYKSPFKSICHCRTQSHQTSNSTVVECTLYIKLDELLFVVVWYILWVSQVWAFVFKQEFQFLTLISIAHNLSIIQLKSKYANLKGNSRRVSWNKKKCQFFLATSWKWANLWFFSFI